MGRPCSGGRAFPARTAFSAIFASLRACFKSVATMALTFGFTASIRLIHASRSSVGEMSPRPINCRASEALNSLSSFMFGTPWLGSPLIRCAFGRHCPSSNKPCQFCYGLRPHNPNQLCLGLSLDIKG